MGVPLKETDKTNQFNLVNSHPPNIPLHMQTAYFNSQSSSSSPMKVIAPQQPTHFSLPQATSQPFPMDPFKVSTPTTRSNTITYNTPPPQPQPPQSKENLNTSKVPPNIISNQFPTAINLHSQPTFATQTQLRSITPPERSSLPPFTSPQHTSSNNILPQPILSNAGLSHPPNTASPATIFNASGLKNPISTPISTVSSPPMSTSVSTPMSAPFSSNQSRARIPNGIPNANTSGGNSINANNTHQGEGENGGDEGGQDEGEEVRVQKRPRKKV